MTLIYNVFDLITYECAFYLDSAHQRKMIILRERKMSLLVLASEPRNLFEYDEIFRGRALLYSYYESITFSENILSAKDVYHRSTLSALSVRKGSRLDR